MKKLALLSTLLNITMLSSMEMEIPITILVEQFPLPKDIRNTIITDASNYENLDKAISTIKAISLVNKTSYGKTTEIYGDPKNFVALVRALSQRFNKTTEAIAEQFATKASQEYIASYLNLYHNRDNFPALLEIVDPNYTSDNPEHLPPLFLAIEYGAGKKVDWDKILGKVEALIAREVNIDGKSLESGTLLNNTHYITGASVLSDDVLTYIKALQMLLQLDTSKDALQKQFDPQALGEYIYSFDFIEEHKPLCPQITRLLTIVDPNYPSYSHENSSPLFLTTPYTVNSKSNWDKAAEMIQSLIACGANIDYEHPKHGTILDYTYKVIGKSSLTYTHPLQKRLDMDSFLKLVIDVFCGTDTEKKKKVCEHYTYRHYLLSEKDIKYFESLSKCYEEKPESFDESKLLSEEQKLYFDANGAKYDYEYKVCDESIEYDNENYEYIEDSSSEEKDFIL